MYPVFKKRGDSPFTYVNVNTAIEWRENGAVVFFRSNLGPSLRLTGEYKNDRDNSCQMGPAVMEANADNVPWAVACTDGWKAELEVSYVRARC